ncbi:MAG: toprim domain-containing protein [Candidatus Thiothrix moscowensis]|nr:toprim domain-containing protein [Candidatus Thiothrix moscowensis]
MFQKNNAPRNGGKKAIYQNASLYSSTYHEGITGFQDAIAAAGLGKPDIKPDGTIHRFRVDSDKAGTLNGWYVYFPVPVPAGAFGSWKTGQSEKWCIKADHELSHVERQQLAQQLEDARKARKAEQQRQWNAAADKAVLRWGAAKPLDGVSIHPYLKHKQVQAHGLKLEGRGMLLVPLRDVSGRLWSLQTITEAGEKRFVGGGKVSGCFHTIGTIDPAGLLFVCEGYATAASIHKMHGAAVACAMFADNLLPVALAIRARYPKAGLVIAGDNDRFTAGNPGATKAEAAARAVGGRWVIPEFPPECSSGTDFNDLAVWEAAHHDQESL